jgi:hypothetical protein
MIDALFGSILGGTCGSSPEWRHFEADMRAAIAKQMHDARVYGAGIARVSMKELPSDIFWTRTGGNTHRVVIRREPELVPDYSWIGMEAALK